MKKINYITICSLLLTSCSGNTDNSFLSESESGSISESEYISESGSDTMSEIEVDKKDHFKVNYHGHTKRCNHAIGTDEEYVLAAINNGYDLIGFSDHVMLPWTNTKNYVRGIYIESYDYYDSINSLKTKYKDQIDILLGYECEWNDLFKDYYQYLLDSHTVDYLIFGNHYLIYSKETGLFTLSTYSNDTKAYVLEYIDNAIKALNSGLFKIFAHPDYFMSNFDSWDDEIETKVTEMCQVAKNNGVALEINQGDWIHNNVFNGRVRYPYDKFWDVVSKVGNVVVTGVDAHEPSAYGVSKGRTNAFNLAASKNITITEDLHIASVSNKRNEPTNFLNVVVNNGQGSKKLEKYGCTYINANKIEGKAFSNWKIDGKNNYTYPSSFYYLNENGNTGTKTFEPVYIDFTSYSHSFTQNFAVGNNQFGDLIWNSNLASNKVETGYEAGRGIGFVIANKVADNTLILKSEIPFKVNQVSIKAAIGQGNDTKMTITIGGVIVAENVVLTNQSTTYTYSCNNLTGEIVIKYVSSVSDKYSYIHSISLS